MGTHRFIVEEKLYEVEVGPRFGDEVQVIVNGKVYRVRIAAPPEAVAVRPSAASPAAPASSGARAPVPQAPAPAEGEVRAPIPGLVLSVAASIGQKVAAGTALLILEAMKMENPILAPTAGVVKAVHVKPQQQVAQGELLVTIEPVP